MSPTLALFSPDSLSSFTKANFYPSIFPFFPFSRYLPEEILDIFV